MSGPRIVAELDAMESLKEFRTHMYRNFVFHRGHSTFYTIPWLMGVNLPIDMLHLMDSAYGFETGTTDTAVIPGSAGTPTDLFTDYYLWGNRTGLTIANMSQLPVYVKIWTIKPRDNFPVSTTYPTSAVAPLKSYGAQTDNSAPGIVSLPIDLLVSGWKKKLLDSQETGNEGIFTTDQGNTGGSAADGSTIDIGEGTNAAGTGTAKVWGGSTNPEYGVAAPTNLSLFDSTDFCQNFEIVNCEKVVIGEDCHHYVELKDLKLKVINFDSDIRRTWQYTTFHYNKQTRFLLLEVKGSLIAPNVFKDIASTLAGTDAVTDNLNIEAGLERAYEHAGQIALKFEKQYNTGFFTNPGQNDGDHIVQITQGVNKSLYGYHDADIGQLART